MPGVPTSRGCNQCRQRKRKCDEAQPFCSRCVRLGLTCKGSGQQRFHFVQSWKPSSSSPKEDTSSESETSSVASMSPTPSQSAYIANTLVFRLEVADLRYGVTSYDKFLRDLPRHLKESPALEAALDAFSTASSEFGLEEKSSSLFDKYGHALKMLREELSVSSETHLVELSCAIYLLMLVQAWIWKPNDPYVNHEEGIAYLVEVLARSGSNAFQLQVVSSLCVPVLFGSMTCPRFRLSPEAWAALRQIPQYRLIQLEPSERDLFDGDCRHDFPSLQLPNIGRLPCFLEEPESHHEEIQSVYNMASIDIEKLCQRLGAFASNMQRSDPNQNRLHRDHLAAASLALAIAIGLNQILQAFEPMDTSLHEELAFYQMKIMNVARDVLEYKPFGTGFMAGCLSVAWASAAESPIQARIKELLLNSLYGFDEGDSGDMSEWWNMKFMTIRARLGNPKPTDIPRDGRPEYTTSLSYVSYSASHNYLEADFI